MADPAPHIAASVTASTQQAFLNIVQHSAARSARPFNRNAKTPPKGPADMREIRHLRDKWVRF
ncbi:hypothetical protein [Tateyamaria sp. SN3-11]|uniref:hypothetical protein n=1 Tax=Tateyamaria sp. SN3-11 TaxID=3092147 RepID=UPI0039ED2FFC